MRQPGRVLGEAVEVEVEVEAVEAVEAVEESELMPEHVSCNLCSAVEYAPIYTHRSGRVASVVCLTCGLAYLSPRPDAAEVESFYAGYQQAYPDEYLMRAGNNFAVTASERAEFAAAWVSRDSRILEVGCGYGHFLDQMGRRGFAVQGIEPSRPQVEFCRERFGVRDVTCGTAASLRRDESVDLLAMFHVIEHVRQPLDVLTACAETLREDGILFLDLPNALCLPATAIEHLYVISGQHLYSFTPAVMELALEIAGFEPIYVAHHPLSAVYPSNLRVIARRRWSRAGALVHPARAQQTIEAMRQYHQGLTALGDRINKTLTRWASTGVRVALYGGGFHTRGLLDLCDFGRVRLEVVIDDDPAKHGTQVGGIDVRGPQALRERGIEAILVSSLAAETAIASKLHGHAANNGVEVVTIYDGARAPHQDRRVYRGEMRL